MPATLFALLAAKDAAAPCVMRTKLNARFIVYASAILVVLAAAAHILHGYQVGRNAKTLLRVAIQAEEIGDLGRSVFYLRHYLSYAPTDAEALEKLASILQRQPEAPQVRSEITSTYDQLLRWHPDHHDARRRMADFLMASGRFEEAATHYEILDRANPNDSELERLLGSCAEAIGDNKKAQDWYAAAIKAAPTNAEAYLRLAQLYRKRLNDSGQADQLMERMLKENPHSFQAYLARARYRATWGEGGAERDLAEARRLAPNDAAVLLASASQLNKPGRATKQDLEEARGYLQHGVARYPHDARMYQALAALDLRADQPEMAAASLRSGLKALEGVPGRNDLRWLLTDLLIGQGKTEEASAQMTQLRAEGNPPAMLDYLDARLDIVEQKWGAGRDILDRIRPLVGHSPDLSKQTDVLLAECYEHLGRPDLQLEAYRHALATDQLWLPARKGLAATLLAMGRIDAALDQYRSLIADLPEAGIMVARLLILKNLRLPPERRNWQEIKAVLDKLSADMPGTADVALLNAEILLAQAKLAQAQQLLEQTCVKRPSRIELWVALAECEDRQGNATAAEHTLAEARQKLGDHYQLRLARITMATGAASPERGRVLEQTEKQLRNFSAEEQCALLAGLASAWQRRGDNSKAERLWNQLAERQPQDLRTHLALFDLALESGNAATLQRVVASVKQIEGEEGAVWRYGEAARLLVLAKQGDGTGLAQAHHLLAEAGARRPNWSNVPLLEAEIDDLEGKPDFALEHYRRALALGSRPPAAVQRLVQLLYERRRYLDADDVLRQLQEAAPLPAELGRLAVEISLHNRDPQRALTLAQSAVAAQPTDYRNYLWHGFSLGASGRAQEAEAAFRHAVELAGRVPETWVALIDYLTRTRQGEKAQTALLAARKMLLSEEGRLGLAQCYELARDRGRAAEIYQSMLQEKPSDALILRTVASFYLRGGELRQAKPVLSSMLANAVLAPATDVRWARRNLAIALTAEGTFEKFREAMALLALNDEAAGASVEDRRVQATLLATQVGRQAEALRLLEELDDMQVLTANDQFLLAKLNESLGNWTRAGRKLFELLGEDPDNPVILAHYARTLLSRGEPQEAALYVGKLEKLQPGASETVEMKARLLHAQGKDTEADTLLQGFVQGKPPEDLPAVAALLEELGQPLPAGQLYREYVARSKQAGSVLALAGFLARQNRPREALDLCDRAWRTCPLEDVSLASVVVLYRSPADEAMRERVALQLLAQLRDHPNHPALLFNLANVRSLQERLDEAESLYRRVIQLDEQNAEALSNLAYLLAVRGGRASEAQTLIDRAVAVAGPSPDRQDTQAVIQMAQGSSNRAINTLEQLVATSPTPSRYFHLAQAYVMGQNRTAAAATLQKATKLGLGPDSVHPVERNPYAQLIQEFGIR